MNDASPQEIQGSIFSDRSLEAFCRGFYEAIHSEGFFDESALTSGSDRSEAAPDTADKGYVWFYIPWLKQEIQQGLPQGQMDLPFGEDDGLAQRRGSTGNPDGRYETTGHRGDARNRYGESAAPRRAAHTDHRTTPTSGS